MRAHFDVVDRQSSPQEFVHGLDSVNGDKSVADIRLVCHQDQHETGLLKRRQRPWGVVVDAKVLDATWRKAPPVAHFRDHEDPITVEKDGPAPAVRHAITTSSSGLAG